MDPDAEAEQAASQILRTTFISVVFTACTYYKTETTASVNNIQFSLPDSTAIKVADSGSLPDCKAKAIVVKFRD